MIYELLYPLRHSASWLGWLNVLRYVPFRAIAATMTAMFICFFLSPWFIRELQKKQIGQVVRDEGLIPEAHLKKRGTPTMGGALLLMAVLGSTIMWCDVRNTFVLAATTVTASRRLTSTSTRTAEPCCHPRRATTESPSHHAHGSVFRGGSTSAWWLGVGSQHGIVTRTGRLPCS